jgi:hypothetical protein
MLKEMSKTTQLSSLKTFLMAIQLGVLASAVMLSMTGGTSAQGRIPADLELVLAVDASGSVDDGEFSLQMQGIAQAFRNSEIQRAISSGPAGQVAVALIVWADHQVPKDNSGWHVLRQPADAEAFARIVAGFPRRQNGATGISEGIAAAVRAIETNAIEGRRKVVDVSGDGQETPARDFVVLLPQARIMAMSRGVTINGLAIINEDPTLLEYYKNRVRTGPDSFIMGTTDYAGFAEAIRRKLLREIDYRPNVSLR